MSHRRSRTSRTVQLTLAALVAALVWIAAGATPASATDNPDYTAPPPTTVVTTPAPAAETSVKTAVAVAPLRTSLAITGSDATGLAVFGSVLVATGAGILVLRRRKAATI